MPDKAIDLVDEAAAKLKMEMTTKPAVIDSLERNVRKLEMEKLSLKNDKDPASVRRMMLIENQLERMRHDQVELSG